MQFPLPLRLSEFFEQGDGVPAQILISGVGSPEQYTSSDIVFVFNARQLDKIITPPSFLIIEDSLKSANTINSPHLYVKQVRFLFQKFMEFVYQKFFALTFSPEIHPTALIDSTATLACDVRIGPYCVVGPNCKINSGVSLQSHVVLEKDVVLEEKVCLDHHVTCYEGVSIGAQTRVCSHSTLGSPGFGFEKDHQGWHHIPHLASLKIGERCFIGAHVSIACGVLHPTVIEDDVILDNQIQIAHHVRIGEGTAIAGCTAIAGSTRIGKNCMIGGACAIAGHLEVADNVAVTGMSMVTKSLLASGSVYSSGWPASLNQEWRRQAVSLSQLPSLLKDFKKIQQTITFQGE